MQELVLTPSLAAGDALNICLGVRAERGATTCWTTAHPRLMTGGREFSAFGLFSVEECA